MSECGSARDFEAEADPCGSTSVRRWSDDELQEKVASALAAQGVTLDEAGLARLADQIQKSIRKKAARHRRWAAPEPLADDDILRWVLAAKGEGDLDEALWRAFLAAHFSRMTAREARHAGRAPTYAGDARESPYFLQSP
jgi:hypothetical protein